MSNPKNSNTALDAALNAQLAADYWRQQQNTSHIIKEARSGDAMMEVERRWRRWTTVFAHAHGRTYEEQRARELLLYVEDQNKYPPRMEYNQPYNECGQSWAGLMALEYVDLPDIRRNTVDDLIEWLEKRYPEPVR